MNLREHAVSELTRTGLMPTDCEMQQQMNDHILKMVDTFCEEGHSGFSASYALGILEKLLDFKPLKPIEDTPESWEPCYQVGDTEPFTLQHKHYSSVFKNSKTGQAYDVSAYVMRNQNGITYTNGTFKPVKFPYMPPKSPQYIDVYDRDEDQ